MIIWSFQESTKLWTDTVRVGEIGGNTLGFYGCKFAPDAAKIVGHGYLGSLHMWRMVEGSWRPEVTPKGHSDQAVDIGWDPKGEYVMSVGYDQTSRVHAPWVRNGEVSWHEIARPQVHGYDMSCLAILSRYKFVSGADEKIVRVFEAPQNFVENFRSLTRVEDDFSVANGPRGASVPSLGLSNKAVYETSNEDSTGPNDDYPEESYFHETLFEEPPTEENLLQNTLWPETHKLYGHGYEIFSVASSHDGKLVASSCKSTVAKHAAIILWDVENVRQVQTLPSHTLTVTRISFSPDDRKILSVSRDRRLSVFEREGDSFSLTTSSDKKNGIHSRIIWCCDWSHDSKYFATCSRDGKAVVWGRNGSGDGSLGRYAPQVPFLEHKDRSMTAIAFGPVFVDDSYVLCVGFESGEIKVYKWNERTNWVLRNEMDVSHAHHKAVKRIRFRPTEGRAGANEGAARILQFASCGADHSVKIHNLYV